MAQDDIVSLFEGDPEAHELIQIFKAHGEIHIMLNGNITLHIDEIGLRLFKEAFDIADTKNNLLKNTK